MFQRLNVETSVREII